ncbi:MAG: hypothetical protein AAFQ41_00385 [Cyanobacteria bacterium J06623_7]
MPEKLPRELLEDAVEALLKNISTANGYYTDYLEVEYASDLPTEYGQNGLYWRDGKGEGEFGSSQKAKVWIEVDGILVETADKPARTWGTLALTDLERAFKSIGLRGAMSTKFKSDKWVETKGKTVCHVYFAVLVQYQNCIR